MNYAVPVFDKMALILDLYVVFCMIILEFWILQEEVNYHSCPMVGRVHTATWHTLSLFTLISWLRLFVWFV